MTASLLDLPRVIADYVEAFNAGDMARLHDLFTPDAQIWGVLGFGGLDAVEPIWRELHHGMAMHLEPQGVAVDGPVVAVRFRETGCFQGAFRGLPGLVPTHRNYEIVAIEWFELAGDRIARRWGVRDSASIGRQVAGC